MQGGRVDAGADDGRVGWAFAALFIPDGGHFSGDGALSHARLDEPHHLALRGNRGCRGFLQQINFAGVLHFAQGHSEGVDIVGRGGVCAQGRGGITQQRFGGFDAGLRPEVDGDSAIVGDQLVQVCGEVRHGLDAVDAGGLRDARSGGVHLGAGVGFHA